MINDGPQRIREVAQRWERSSKVLFSSVDARQPLPPVSAQAIDAAGLPVTAAEIRSSLPQTREQYMSLVQRPRAYQALIEADINPHKFRSTIPEGVGVWATGGALGSEVQVQSLPQNLSHAQNLPSMGILGRGAMIGSPPPWGTVADMSVQSQQIPPLSQPDPKRPPPPPPPRINRLPMDSSSGPCNLQCAGGGPAPP
eukprot:TRINITY_DN4929_c0_g6_i1.p1 TRINITY_DN4929_c0_g6~~TRINITY_DN4929_c0_g6_i1.p1  ORF type:complete len:210 (-),score=37.19 TRINITY_DN4929_c0_g6_i1:163-756(-)